MKTKRDYAAAVLTHGERIFDRILFDDGCWGFKGWHWDTGYAAFDVDGSGFRAHRLVYTMLVGPVPNDMVLDHLCRNRGCVRPDHLEIVTQRINVSRNSEATKTHCVNGHLLSGDNLYLSPGRHHRLCRACNRERQKKYKARKKEALTS